MSTRRMPLRECLQILRDVRTDQQIVVPTMGSAREWMVLGEHPLDFIYAPSAMGHAPLVGLGLALAQPQRQVIVGNGDGCLLMNLGCLVTITAAAPSNYVLIVFDNGVYEVTGGQQTAASAAARPLDRPVDFVSLARGAGFLSTYEFDTLEGWRAGVRNVLAAAGPTFVVLKVEPVIGGAVPKSPAPAPERARQFAEAVQRGG